MGHTQPRRMVEEYGSVMVMILRLAAGTLDLGDPTFQLVAIETVVHIGSSPEGILALAKFSRLCYYLFACEVFCCVLVF